ncbi:MAG TPA: hypothetical protein VFW87_20780 [Pirellulales bacterium]|nr:hypothetical protein [Pirellulales bacterium]
MPKSDHSGEQTSSEPYTPSHYVVFRVRLSKPLVGVSQRSGVE